MSAGMSDDMDNPELQNRLKAARQDFPQFYLLASPEEEWAMDGLVMLRVVVLKAFNGQRAFVPAVIRKGLEETTDAVERSFTEFREAVEASATFARIDAEERAKIVREVFEVSAPTQK